jgi:cation diffusion facilitator family transporter
MSQLPPEIRDDMRRARRLEWATLGWMASVVVVMFFATGSSQAMRTALIEDVLSLVPAMTFLLAARLEPREPTRKYPFGFVRVNSLAFLASAVVLTLVGAWLLAEGLMGLFMAEHPTIEPVELFGQTVWLGWVMIAALTYSVIPPLILGRLKLPVARRLNDKVLHTDALMQKADWRTGLAGIVGVLGVALGFWWTDALAAAVISLSILKDGISNMRTAAAELLDGAPRALESSDIAPDAAQLQRKLEDNWPGAQVRLRESGRYIMASVEEVDQIGDVPPLRELMGGSEPWRLAQVSFSLKGSSRPSEDEA